MFSVMMMKVYAGQYSTNAHRYIYQSTVLHAEMRRVTVLLGSSYSASVKTRNSTSAADNTNQIAVQCTLTKAVLFQGTTEEKGRCKS